MKDYTIYKIYETYDNSTLYLAIKIVIDVKNNLRGRRYNEETCIFRLEMAFQHLKYFRYILANLIEEIIYNYYFDAYGTY